jgi:hypothetical protein
MAVSANAFIQYSTLTMNITVIGYGSLMSGTGLSSSGALQVKDARVVALEHCRRGFAKLSSYGDRFAMNIAAPAWPLAGRVVSPASPPTNGVEALALTVPADDACRLAKREGYNPEIMQRLVTLAHARGDGVATFLWQLHEEAAHDIVAYRRRLFTLTGFTSPHYIPHPVALEGGAHAVIFLAPGVEGTGSEEVISVRQKTGIHEPMSAPEAWRRKQNEDQMIYFVFCLLGGAHGIGMQDVLGSIPEDTSFAQLLSQRLRQAFPSERALFLTTTGLSSEQYRAAFGDPEAALRRSGLADFWRRW